MKRTAGQRNMMRIKHLSVLTKPINPRYFLISFTKESNMMVTQGKFKRPNFFIIIQESRKSEVGTWKTSFLSLSRRLAEEF